MTCPCSRRLIRGTGAFTRGGRLVAPTPEYLVSHGKTGALGRFVAASPEPYRRGDRVVVRGERGLTVGVVLCETTERQARLLGGVSQGQLLGHFGPEQEAARRDALHREQQIFDASRH